MFLNKSQLSETKEMEIFIRSKARDAAAKELLTYLNMELARRIVLKRVKEVRLILCDIVEEALTGLRKINNCNR